MTDTPLQHFIDGAYTSGRNGRTFENRRPIDHSLISLVYEAGKDEVDAAVRAAREALSGEWSRLTLAQRTDMLCAVADGIESRFDAFLEAEIADTGKPVSIASHIDIPRGAANFRIFADVVKNVAGEYFETPTPDGTGAINYSVRVPKGVVAVVFSGLFSSNASSRGSRPARSASSRLNRTASLPTTN